MWENLKPGAELIFMRAGKSGEKKLAKLNE
jgi:hypothetical protein